MLKLQERWRAREDKIETKHQLEIEHRKKREVERQHTQMIRNQIADIKHAECIEAAYQIGDKYKFYKNKEVSYCGPLLLDAVLI